MKSISFLLFSFMVLVAGSLFSQTDRVSKAPFTLKGKVVEAETYAPISRVNIEILGGSYTTTNNAGEFAISAKIGDEITIRSDDFKTVYYTIKDRQSITVEVQKAEVAAAPVKAQTKTESRDLFKTYIDSSGYFLKKDAQKSIEYVTKALESVRKNASSDQNAIAFEALGDINLFWGQSDLAVDNYKRSIVSSAKINTRIKLATAFTTNKNYQESISEYQSLLKERLTNYQRIEVYEGLGNTYKAINDLVKSVFNYQKALDIANEHKIIPKITDLNSFIGGVYAQSGAKQEAAEYFDNSLNLAKKENKKRAVAEKNTVADFYNQNRDFEKEIQLREEALDEIKSLDDAEQEEDINSPLTAQRQNYKIANAYVGQEKYKEAIPYLEKSIREADKKEDLVVQKDATRKLSEIYRDIGEFGKAAESYERYVEVVDELYIKKEQEISQASRFSREIALKQNRIISLESERELNESRYQLAFENQELIEKNNRVQKWIIGSLILIALLLLLIAYTQYKSVKQQKFANNLLALKTLRTQMNPHFIFNALNSVNSFISSHDERAANKYLTDFSQLMRSVLENSDEDFIPLAKEIELLELYVGLEHSRFENKFDYTITVDEYLKVSEFVIPPMLLQPYVENAVWHGLRYKEEKGLLEIHFQQTDSETVQITISDNGIGRKKSKELKTDHQKNQKSKGMGNIQKRISILNKMYKDKVDVTVANIFENEEGTRVILILKKD
ncbi:tetratricopeptide repeat protein [Ulvibacter sp. MAR_2010_11]|uniref:histidine kinase n=1 Tax=Ulvibacter sp. MAR_2010_11 TaxID=1250229 RepID=UPI000C2C2DF5|nr:histidine kinase [Ulvibacter sp. MAR_2010_11]PKA83284.1 tetratricopeptide repeat protein [Ulvibacter sp. MAR_2010_11]